MRAQLAGAGKLATPMDKAAMPAEAATSVGDPTPSHPVELSPFAAELDRSQPAPEFRNWLCSLHKVRHSFSVSSCCFALHNDVFPKAKKVNLAHRSSGV